MKISRKSWHFRYYCFLKSWWVSNNVGYILYRDKSVDTLTGKVWTEYPVDYSFVPASPFTYVGMILFVGTFFWLVFLILLIPCFIAAIFTSGSVEVEK